MSKLGAHIVQGPRNGYGPMCVSRPAVVLSHGDGGALAEAKQKSGGHTYTIYRHVLWKDSPQGIDQWTPKEAVAAAESLYPQLKAVWALNPADYHTVLNEPAGNNAGIIPTYIAFERRVMELAAADGYKICALNLAGGTPADINVWKSLYVPYLREVFTAGGIYGRHCYGGPKLSIPDGNTNRAFIEAEYLRSVGLGGGGIVITEAGTNGGYGFVGVEEFMADVSAYDTQVRQHPNIIGPCLWTLGDWDPPNPNWQAAIPAMTVYLQNNPTPKWMPGTVAPPPKPKVVILKKPQKSDMTEAENAAANAYAWSQYGRTTTHSVDDMMTMLRSGNEDSYAIIAYPDRTSQAEAMDALLGEGFDWVNWPDAPGNPLIGLKLGHILPYRYMLTSPFNAPRTYGPHEGADYDLVGGEANNRTNVLCAYPGVVDISLDSTGGYGRYVRVKHTRNGGTFYTRYAHLDARFVAVGDSVNAGDPVGEIGSTGTVTGEHVHLNLEVPGFGATGYVVPWVVDPEPYMALGRNELPLVPPAAIDMTPYFLPASGNFGQILILKNNWGGGDERCQLQRDGNISYVTKNSQYEKRLFSLSGIILALDTSPGNGEYYTSTGVWMPTQMSVGQVFTRTQTISFFSKRDCVATKPAYTSTSSIKLSARHVTWTCPESRIKLTDVIEVQWIAGGRVDETYWYAKGLGLVRWLKYSGQKSWIHELVPYGSQANNAREAGCFS